MRFRCPSCDYQADVGIPAGRPRGKPTKIRCQRCGETAIVALGRLFPQDSERAYRTLLSGEACPGRKIGELWLETLGARKSLDPILALPSGRAFSHRILHDLLDPMGAHTRVCYLELPAGRGDPAEILIKGMDRLKVRLKSESFHLFAHLSSAPLALRLASKRPRAIRSLVLISPRLAINRAGPLWKDRLSRGELKEEERRKLAQELLAGSFGRDEEEMHRAGLARILAQDLSVQALVANKGSRRAPSYRRLSRILAPAQLFVARDSPAIARAEAFFLRASLPRSQSVALERGGAWAAWRSSTFFSNRLLPFLKAAQRGKPDRGARKGATLAGQALAPVLLLALVLTWGLQALLHVLPGYPEIIRQSGAVLLGALLPLLWLTLPRGIPLRSFFRFDHFPPGPAAGGLATGLFLGLSWFFLLQGLGAFSWALPEAAGRFLEAAGSWPALRPVLAFISDTGLLCSPPGGEPARWALLAASFPALILSSSFAANLLCLRRSRLWMLVPALIFALIPLSFPDLAWKLLLGAAAAFLFRSTLSAWPPLALYLGFCLASELPLLLPDLPALPFLGIHLAGYPGLLIALALILPAAALLILSGSDRRHKSPQRCYLLEPKNLLERRYSWDPNRGAVAIVFSLIGALALIAAFAIAIP